MKTTRVCYKTDEYDVLVARPSIFGNPYSHIKHGTMAQFVVGSREEAIAAYREYITNGDGKHLLKQLYKLKGKRLACACPLFLPCHADVLVELAEALPEQKFTVEGLLGNK